MIGGLILVTLGLWIEKNKNDQFSVGGCRIVAIMSAFQAEEGGSIPLTRSTHSTFAQGVAQ